MEFHDLEVLITVARQKSFSKAAKIMLRTQPAISLSIRRLEDDIGEKLFDRTSKQPILTYEGEVLMDYALKILDIKKNIYQTLQDLKGLHRGRLKIGTNEIGTLALLDLLALFRAQYPNVFVDVIRYSSKDILYAITKRDIDFGVLSYVSPDTDFIYNTLFKDQMCCVAYPNHPLAKADKTYAIQRLENQTFVAHQAHSLNKMKIQKLFEKHHVPLNVEMQLPSIESIKHYVINGHAIAILPLITVQHELKEKRLKRIQIKEINALSADMNIELVHSKKNSLSHASEALLELFSKRKALNSNSS